MSPGTGVHPFDDAMREALALADAITQDPDSTPAQPDTAVVSAPAWARLGVDAQQIKSSADEAMAGAREIAALLLEPAT